jgi:1-acyl-sn-glycerol-3-phosphate acyltransferase
LSSVFRTPVLTPCLRTLARLGMGLAGWKLELDKPVRPPFVFIGAPHTSNWDFLLLISAVLILRLDARWMGKHTLFRFPFGGLMRWLGGIPVNRSSPQNLVPEVASLLRSNPDLIICIPPEGTRRKVEKWKTGFWHIARQAGVPIMMTALDAEHHRLRLLGEFRPGDNMDKEIRQIQEHYRGITGIRAANTFRLPDEEPGSPTT